MSAPAFLLAAGFGTRLRPLTLHRPKPLVPFMGRPLLDQAVAMLLRHGIRDAVANAHHLPDAILQWAGKHNSEGRICISVMNETPEILGTGGGLRNAMRNLADPFVVVNGDILCDVDLGALLAAVPEGGAAMALRALQGESYGVVAHDGSRVVDLVGLAAAAPEGAVDRSTHFTGVHAMTHAALERVPAEGASCVVRTAYASLVPERRVAALPHRGMWVDLGNPEAYLRANLAALDGTLTPPQNNWTLADFSITPDGRASTGSRIHRGVGAVIEGPVWIGAGARIEDGARVGPRVVVGEGAVIGAGAEVRDAVVWDGAEVPAGETLVGGIAHDGGLLSVPLGDR